MKKFLFMCAAAVLTFACTKENDPPSPDPTTKYSITVTGGTATFEGNTVEEASAGDVILLVADAPEEGYEFAAWESEKVTVAGDGTFTMPAGDVSVSARFEPTSGLDAKGAVTVSFASKTANSPAHVYWAEGSFSVQKDREPVGVMNFPTYGGFVELVFVDDNLSVAKFLLRDGDNVQISYDASGYPTATSTIDPSFDEVYNFPGSVGKPSMGPDMYPFDAFRTQRGSPSRIGNSDIASLNTFKENLAIALTTTEMPEVYKHYYSEAYVSPNTMILDDELTVYFSNRYWLTTHIDGVVWGIMMRYGGPGNVPAGTMPGQFDLLAEDYSVPPISKAVMLREILRGAIDSFEGPAVQQEYSEKYVELTGDRDSQPSPLKYETDEVYVETVDGVTTTLDDLVAQNAGKVVYVDIWATWCGPCKVAMPIAAALRPRYPDVVFIYLSIDSNFSEWLGGTNQFNLPNSYRILNFEASDFIQSIQTGTVPQYLFYDKQGNLVSSRAPGPSSVESMFNQYL